MDKRLGRRTPEETVWPVEYASGGAFTANRSPLTWVEIGDGYFYVLPAGRGVAPDGVHDELVAQVTGGQKELPFEAAFVEPAANADEPVVAEAPAEKSRRKKSEGTD